MAICATARGECEAHEVIERAPGEIGIHQRLVDFARMGERGKDGVLGDGVENHPLDRDAAQHALLLQNLQEVPGYRLAFAIRVGGEDQPARSLHRLGDLVDDPLGIRLDLPAHLEIVVRQDGPVLRGQIADMAVGRDDLVAGPEIFVDGFRLGGAFDDDDVHRQRLLLSGLVGRQ